MASPFGGLPEHNLAGYNTDPVFSKVADYWDDSKSYIHRPIAWVQETAKEHLVDVQQQIIESVRVNRYTAVPSCHDSGKSFIASRAIAWWIDSHPPGEAFVVSTAPTAAQVSAILWRELTKVHNKAHLDGRINRAGYPQWYIQGELVGYGRKPADYEQSAFQGIHARYVLVIIDEACGVAESLFTAVDALATNEHARVLAIGNPDDEGSHFASICKPGSGWNVIPIDGLRTVNFTREQIVGDNPLKPKFPLVKTLMEAENIPYSTEPVPSTNLREMFLSPLWVEERIERWAGIPKGLENELSPEDFTATVVRRCATSPVFASKVRGLFPTSSSTGVIPLGWVQLAINRWMDWDLSGRPESPGRRVVGIDVAYGGEDETAIAVRQGAGVMDIHRYRNADTVETALQASRFLLHPGAMAVVDVIGIGAGVYDTLRSWNHKGTITAECIPFNAAAQSGRQDLLGQFRFRNDRAAAWWNLRQLLDPSRGSTVMLPPDDRMLGELVAVQYKHLVGGVIQIEDKDQIRKRIGRSTDSADAVVQAFWVSGVMALGDNTYPYRPGHKGDGIQRYDGAPMFSENDLVATPGKNWLAGNITHTAPGIGSLPGDNYGGVNWEV